MDFTYEIKEGSHKGEIVKFKGENSAFIDGIAWAIDAVKKFTQHAEDYGKCTGYKLLDEILLEIREQMTWECANYLAMVENRAIADIAVVIAELQEEHGGEA